MTQLLLRLITGSILFFTVSFLYFFAPPWALSVLLLFALFEILFFEWPAFILFFLTPIYPILPFLILIALNKSGNSFLLPFLFLVVCCHDSCAYLIGRLWGKHYLMPRISPKKTWEGFVGGTIGSLTLALFIRLFIFAHFPLPLYILFVLALNISALGGDLFESYLKRCAHLKDSGSLLPGHGGLLDRFDSILPSAAILYMIWLFFPQLFL
jgi:phosphatidate cytidylyltransferase